MTSCCGKFLSGRVREAGEMLRHCSLCERRCGANRLAGQTGFCGLGVETHCFRRHLSFSEELELLPSYMVYLSGCNFRCRFCVQAPTSLEPASGELVSPGDFAAVLAQACESGARTINLVGGEPSLHLHTLLELAAGSESPLPLVLNTNLYMTPEVLRLLDGVIATYLADYKFGNDSCAREIAGVERYNSVVQRNLIAAAGQGRLIVRHLLLPGHVKCCFEPVARWMAGNLPGVPLHVMGSYVHGWQSADDDNLRRLVSSSEFAQALRLRDKLGIAPYEE